MWNVECGTWNVERGTWNVERGTWNVERGTWNVECGTWNVEGQVSFSSPLLRRPSVVSCVLIILFLTDSTLWLAHPTRTVCARLHLFMFAYIKIYKNCKTILTIFLPHNGSTDGNPIPTLWKQKLVCDM